MSDLSSEMALKEYLETPEGKERLAKVKERVANPLFLSFKVIGVFDCISSALEPLNEEYRYLKDTGRYSWQDGAENNLGITLQEIVEYIESGSYLYIIASLLAEAALKKIDRDEILTTENIMNMIKSMKECELVDEDFYLTEAILILACYSPVKPIFFSRSWKGPQILDNPNIKKIIYQHAWETASIYVPHLLASNNDELKQALYGSSEAPLSNEQTVILEQLLECPSGHRGLKGLGRCRKDNGEPTQYRQAISRSIESLVTRGLVRKQKINLSNVVYYITELGKSQIEKLNKRKEYKAKLSEVSSHRLFPSQLQ